MSIKLMTPQEEIRLLKELRKYCDEHELTGSFELGDVVHDVASTLASNINNMGIERQVDFLMQQLGYEHARDLLEAATDSRQRTEGDEARERAWYKE